MPNRSSSCARVAASTGNGLSGRTNRSTLSIALLSSVASEPASFCSATNSLCRSVRAVSASSPGHRHHRLADARLVHLAGEPFGHVLRRQHRVDAAGADLVGPRCDPDDAQRSRRPTDELPICLSSAMSAALRVRNRNTTASTRGTPSAGTNSRSVRSEASRVSDEVPGVSMMVVSTSSSAGHSTSRSTTSAGLSAAEVEASARRCG